MVGPDSIEKKARETPVTGEPLTSDTMVESVVVALMVAQGAAVVGCFVNKLKILSGIDCDQAEPADVMEDAGSISLAAVLLGPTSDFRRNNSCA
jgi:hypothetical protein